ncbi:aromatic-ring-hydroxylating dioxygenase subunit beta [Actinomadura harenae]|uniref:3-phenylpropionate/cinnamic acid dioxygenase subunit beta n=1 Tax=Actinomadura harenae TaxID=2483351 RepID=A0A3M2M481_9ACTN|nr:3-phenylpropionate/cinnamic acid dioxygenase subunit beta [Actinomadura harenae]RMI44351.1 3-phenylpropionate/cinnamic acid dioxygenase subunit beta [Actinomadura harenae]
MTTLLPEAALDRLLLQHEVEQFLFREADLLDRHEFDAWLELFADDLRYVMPIRLNLPSKDGETRESEQALALFDDDKPFLEARVRKLRTGSAWAEEPPSRTVRLVTNVMVGAPDPETGDFAVTSRFLLNRNRHEDEEDTYAGSRADRFRRTSDGLRIFERRIMLNQSVVLSKNLGVLF